MGIVREIVGTFCHKMVRFFSKVHYKGPLLLNFKDGIKHMYPGRRASQYRKGNHGGLGLLPNNP